MQIDDKPIYGHGASCVGIAHTFNGNGCVGYSSFSQLVFHGNSRHVEVIGDVSRITLSLLTGDGVHVSTRRKHAEESLASAW